MNDIQSIIENYRLSKKRKMAGNGPTRPNNKVSDVFSEIPNVFFDKILVEFKLSRIETLVVMYIYRQVWCRQNLYKEYGISQLLSHTEISNRLKISMDEIYHALRKLEELSLIETVRLGQYFVRKFFTKENDELQGQNYHDFDV